MVLYSPSTGGFYDKNIHASIPVDAIEISNDKRDQLLKGQSTGKEIAVDSRGELTLVDPMPVPPEHRRIYALNQIDTAAGAARLRYVSAGQLIEEEYRQALSAVQQWRAAGSPADAVPPEIVSGAEYSGITAEEAAVEIEQTAADWEGVLAQIRDLRLNGKAAVRAAADDAIESTAQGYIDQLEAMQPVEA